MCGIALFQNSIDKSQCSSSDAFLGCGVDISTLHRRGPDSSSYRIVSVPDSSIPWVAYACVLSLRGRGVTTQPVSEGANSRHSVLLWNGEVFYCSSAEHSTLFHNPANNDGQILASWLTDASSMEDVFNIMSKIHGPFAFILFRNTGHVYFGRDRLGRRSLVVRHDYLSKSSDTSSRLDCIASVVLNSPSLTEEDKENAWCELPAVGLFSGRITTDSAGRSAINHLQLYPWSTDHLGSWQTCTTLRVAHVFPIVAAPTDSHSGLNILNLSPLEVQQAFLVELEAAVAIRIKLAPTTCQNCTDRAVAEECTHARFGILFSGGLDSTVLALLCDRFISKDQPIDLINVAFQTPASNRDTRTGSNSQIVESCEAPDRQTALQSLQELSKLAPSRSWQLVLVDVSLDEMRRIRSGYIRQLLLPTKLSLLDESLGLALWFAARARGHLYGSGKTSLPYTSSAKVLFVGTGIDEQLAGYSRHRMVFEKQGVVGLEKELAMEMRRISERNLGRDDRIISDHGREARFPYLDENVIEFLNRLPLHLKADLRLPRGEGEKILLRKVAIQLGLMKAARLPKRAMQFGSRIAKAEGTGRVRTPADQLTVQSVKMGSRPRRTDSEQGCAK